MNHIKQIHMALEVLDLNNYIGCDPYEYYEIEKRQEALNSLASVGHKSFSRRDLSNLCLEHVSLEYTDFSGANLWRTSFISSSLKGANFRDANMFEVYLLDSDFSFTKVTEALEPYPNNGVYKGISPYSLAKCRNIENICGLGKNHLEAIQRLNPEIMEWWDGKSRDNKGIFDILKDYFVGPGKINWL